MTPDKHEIDRLAEEGNALIDSGKLADAIAVFRKGLDLVGNSTSAALWFIVGIGDAQFLARDYKSAAESFKEALLYGGIGNAFIHLRRGQILFELGDRKEAADELLRALLLGGEELFDDCPQYLTYVTSVARPPEGWSSWEGWTGVEEGSPVHQWLLDPSKYELRPK